MANKKRTNKADQSFQRKPSRKKVPIHFAPVTVTVWRATGEGKPFPSVGPEVSAEPEFPGCGHRTPRLNARRLKAEPGVPGMILLAFEVVTAGRKTEWKSCGRGKDSSA
jgi:hypothetical protein